VAGVEVKDLDAFFQLDGFPGGWSAFHDWRKRQHPVRWSLPFSGFLIIWGEVLPLLDPPEATEEWFKRAKVQRLRPARTA
jgi:hypothetical protein